MTNIAMENGILEWFFMGGHSWDTQLLGWNITHVIKDFPIGIRQLARHVWVGVAAKNGSRAK